MVATKKNLTIYQGATFKMEITHLDTDGETPVLAANVSAARMQVRETYSSLTALLDLDNGLNGGITVADGLITVVVGEGETSALDFEDGVYDLEVEYTDGIVDRLLMGRVFLSREVTQ